MSELPFLADADRVLQAAALETTVLLDAHFGGLATRVDEPAVVDALLKLHSSGNAPDGWPAAVALELLLAQSWGCAINPSLKQSFAEVSPALGWPPLSAWQTVQCAAAAFPLVYGPLEKEPPWALLIVACGFPQTSPDHRQRFETWQDSPLANQPVHAWVRLSKPMAISLSIQDRSWHLAAWLLLQALDQPSLREPLARRWLVTGRVDDPNGGQVGMIEPGNKLRIRTARQFLFPAGNRPDLAGRAQQASARVLFAASGQAALAHITGSGMVNDGLAEWPRPCPVLHSFTSLAWHPVLASVLLAQPARLVLWHSSAEVSKGSAERLETFLQPLQDAGRLKVELKPIPSDDLPAIQKHLRQELEKDLKAHEIVPFNITQGNRFMSYAALLLGQLHPGMRMVYRDLDAPPLEFSQITYESLQGEARKLKPSGEHLLLPEESLLWKYLFPDPNEQKPKFGEQPRTIAEQINLQDEVEKVYRHYRNSPASSPSDSA